MEPLGAVLAFCLPMSDDAPPAKAVVEAFIEAYNRHDAGQVAKLFTADAVINGGNQETTAEIVVERYQSIVFPKYPTVNIKIIDQLVTSDMVAQTEFLTGIGDDVTGLSAYRVTDGCIVSMTFSSDAK